MMVYEVSIYLTFSSYIGDSHICAHVKTLCEPGEEVRDCHVFAVVVDEVVVCEGVEAGTRGADW
jgi:hypothetical protein